MSNPLSKVVEIVVQGRKVVLILSCTHTLETDAGMSDPNVVAKQQQSMIGRFVKCEQCQKEEGK